MTEVTLIFPHQLFQQSPAINRSRPVFLVEEFLFFRQYTFHQQKLAFHRASMKAYEEYLCAKGMAVEYIDSLDTRSDVRKLLENLGKLGVKHVHYIDVVDNWLHQRIKKSAHAQSIQCIEYESPAFLLERSSVESYFGKKKKYFQTDFYIQQRKHFKLLLSNGEPLGGQWTFDVENRLKYPKNKKPPMVAFPQPNTFWQEAKQYVETHFQHHYGSVNPDFIYPTTFEESKNWLAGFLETRLHEFGIYEDALVEDENILHHSMLTPMLNTGLITPHEVIDQTISFAQKNNVPINSLEGFVRQIIGWREFIRGVYEQKGTEERTKNYWKFSRKIPPSFWDGTTGIPPIDSTIKKILNTGYCHHIERLMVLGNFMLLCEFDPDDVYRWFMEMFIDAYDWVMVPNVYG
ncbi:MAG: cryptochrome/photolyase family protein, partial [Flammeovirgaceae bacterium]